MTDKHRTSEAFEYALTQAKDKLQDVESRFTELETERAMLLNLIDALNRYLAGDLTSWSPSKTAATANADDELDVPVWKRAHDVIAANGDAMTVPQIYEKLQSKGAAVNKDSIRVAMIRKRDVFIQVGNGFYGLAPALRERVGGSVTETRQQQQALS